MSPGELDWDDVDPGDDEDEPPEDWDDEPQDWERDERNCHSCYDEGCRRCVPGRLTVLRWRLKSWLRGVRTGLRRRRAIANNEPPF